MTAQTEPIRGKVAKVLTNSKVVLNVGKNHKVQIGMSFDILMPGFDEITDPDTGAVLGGVELPKARVRVISADDNLSVAATYRRESVNLGGPENWGLRVRGDLLPMPPLWETRVETFRTREPVISDERAVDYYVATGDPVVQVFEPPETDLYDGDELL